MCKKSYLKNLVCILITVFSQQVVLSQNTYTFIGNGNWTVTSNWSGTIVPPPILSAGDIININPAVGDTCILNTSQTIAAGASLNIFPGAVFIVSGAVTIMATLPTVITDTVIYITLTSAKSGATVIANGGSAVVEKGLVWDSLPSPTTALSTRKIINDTIDNFIVGLQTGKTWYVRAYAINAVGTAYGDQRSFSTGTVPTVYTDSLWNITTNTATGHVTILSNGSSPIITKGLVWDTLPGPATALSTKTVLNATDTFRSVLTGLLPGRMYYVRAYATNAAGTGYGQTRTFFSQLPPVPDVDSTFTDPRDGQVYTFRNIGAEVWMTQNLNYTTPTGSWCYNNTGTNCATYGRLYNWNTAMTSAPPGWHVASDSEWVALIQNVGGNAGPLKSTSLWQAPNSGATNSSRFNALPGGIRSGNSFFALGTYGYWWTSTEASTFLALTRLMAYSDNSCGSVDYEKTSGYSVRCVSNTSAPSLSTKSASGITDNSAISGGTVISSGGSNVIATGIVWDTNHDPTVKLSTKVTNLSSADTFTNTITGLQPGTVYYARAFATNGMGTNYGKEITFTTPQFGDSTFTDPRDGQVYMYKHIGSQVWMIQNMNYVTPAGSWCYENAPTSCNAYGRLYDWNTAPAAAPPGWHVPTDGEWQTLIDYLGGNSSAGGSMKSTSLAWQQPNVGATNSSGFSGLPAGYFISSSGSFVNIGSYCFWWTSSPENGQGVYRGLYSIGAYIARSATTRAWGMSVRCVRN